MVGQTKKLLLESPEKGLVIAAEGYLGKRDLVYEEICMANS